jgi:recombination protein RecA
MSKEKAGDDNRIKSLLASEALAGLIKKHGKNILQPASEFGVEGCARIPSGIFRLDYALGGGFPAGRVNNVYGPKSGGKTTIYLKTLGNAQKMCATCWTFPDEEGKCKCKKFRKALAAWIDVEGTWDAPWALKHGVNLDELILSQPEYAEQSIDIADQLVRSTQLDVLVIDSLAFLTPSKEIEKSSNDELMGVQARTLGKGIRKFVSGLNGVALETGRRPTLLFTNQIRMKLGVMFGNPETQPGGHAPGFAASTETRVSSGKYEMDDESGRPISVELNFKVEKNKTSPAKMEGEYKMLLADTETKRVGDVLDEGWMVEQAEKIGLVEKKSGDWLCLGEKFSAKSHIERRAMTEPDYKRKLRDALMTILIPQTGVVE